MADKTEPGYVPTVGGYPTDAYVSGDWDEVERAYYRGLISDEQFKVLTDRQKALSQTSVVEVWDWQGQRWRGDHDLDLWAWEDADTDMGHLTWAELNRMCGPLYGSAEDAKAARSYAIKWLKKWLLEARRSNPSLSWEWGL